MLNYFSDFLSDGESGGDLFSIIDTPVPMPAPAPIYTPPPVYEPPASEQPYVYQPPIYEAMPAPAPVYEPPVIYTPAPAPAPVAQLPTDYAQLGQMGLPWDTPNKPDTSNWFTDPNAGWNYDTETMAGPNNGLDVNNLAAIIAPKAEELGWAGGSPLIENPHSGGTSLDPAFAQFVLDKGLNLSGETASSNGMAGVTSYLTDASGNRVSENTYYDEPDPLLDFIWAAAPALVTGGAFGPSFAGAAGVTNPILAAGVNAAATQALTTGTIDPASILTNMATSYVAPTISNAVKEIMPDLSGAIGSTANTAISRAAQDAALAALKGQDISTGILSSLGGSAIGAIAPEVGLTQPQLAAIVNIGLKEGNITPADAFNLVSTFAPKATAPAPAPAYDYNYLADPQQDEPMPAALEPSQIDTMYDQQSLDNLMNAPENALPAEPALQQVEITAPTPAPAEPAFDFNQWVQQQEAALPAEPALQQVEITAPAPSPAEPAFDFNQWMQQQEAALPAEPAPQQVEITAPAPAPAEPAFDFNQWVQDQEAALPAQQVEITATPPRPDYQIPEPPAIDWTTPTDNFTGPTPDEIAAITPTIPPLPATPNTPIKIPTPAPAPAAQKSSGSLLDLLPLLGMMGGNAAEPHQELFNVGKFDVSSLTNPGLETTRDADIMMLLNAMNRRG